MYEVKEDDGRFGVCMNGEIRRNKKGTCIWYATLEAAQRKIHELETVRARFVAEWDPNWKKGN